jgi:large subunit ribosomal protein L25
VHLDFLAVSRGETLRVNVPVNLFGIAPAVNTFQALILQESESLEIEALPKDLPSEFAVDISVLENIGDSVTVADLDIPEGVTILTDPETPLVVAIHSTRIEETEAEDEDGDLFEGAEPELIGDRGGDDEDEG